MWEASPSDEAVRLQLRRAGLVTPDAPREEVLEARFDAVGLCSPTK